MVYLHEFIYSSPPPLSLQICRETKTQRGEWLLQSPQNCLWSAQADQDPWIRALNDSVLSCHTKLDVASVKLELKAMTMVENDDWSSRMPGEEFLTRGGWFCLDWNVPEIYRHVTSCSWPKCQIMIISISAMIMPVLAWQFTLVY